MAYTYDSSTLVVLSATSPATSIHSIIVLSADKLLLIHIFSWSVYHNTHWDSLSTFKCISFVCSSIIVPLYSYIAYLIIYLYQFLLFAAYIQTNFLMSSGGQLGQAISGLRIYFISHVLIFLLHFCILFRLTIQLLVC